MIWFEKKLTIEQVDKINYVNLCELLDIRMTKLTENSLIGEMPLSNKVYQPQNILHGGVSCVLAETLGSVAANCCLDMKKQVALGLEINANHLRQAKEGILIGEATPVKLGKRIHVWSIAIKNNEKLVCQSRMTLSIVDRDLVQ